MNSPQNLSLSLRSRVRAFCEVTHASRRNV